MQDRVPVNPGRVLVTPENGGAAYYATLTRADNPTQEGTPLNKANLLTDATAALFGLGANAVPDDVLRWVGKYNQHWWLKNQYAAPYYTTGDLVATKNVSADGYVYYGDSISVAEDGSLSIQNETKKLCNSAAGRVSLSGKFARVKYSTNPSKFFYCENGATIEYYNSTTLTLTNARPLTGHPYTLTPIGYVQSSNRNAYPDSVISGDFWYTYCGVPFENAVTVPKIETGSYVGTGEYNWSTPVPNELTFSIVPKIVFLYSKDYTNYNTIPTHYFFFNGQSSFMPYETSSGSNALTWSGKTVSWYYNYSASESQTKGSKFQFNTAGKVYYYTAIG